MLHALEVPFNHVKFSFNSKYMRGSFSQSAQQTMPLTSNENYWSSCLMSTVCTWHNKDAMMSHAPLIEKHENFALCAIFPLTLSH